MSGCKTNISLVFLGSVVLLQGCVPVYRDSIRQHTQSIQVSSNPEGASIVLQDENGSRIIGTTPVAFEQSYEVVERTYNKAACALHGGAIVSDAVTTDDGYTSDAEAVVGLIGLMVGAVAGAESCRAAEGIVAVHSKDVTVGAHLPGYVSQAISVQLPKQHPVIHFDMLPAKADRVAQADEPDLQASDRSIEQPGQVSPPDQPVTSKLPDPGRFAVFRIEVTGAGLEQEILEELTDYLTEELDSLADYTAVRTDTKNAAQGNPIDAWLSCLDLACRSNAAKEHSANYVFDTRILHVEDLCMMSTTIFEVGTMKRLLVTASQSSCELDDLYISIDKIIEMFQYPPTKENPGDEDQTMPDPQ